MGRMREKERQKESDDRQNGWTSQEERKEETGKGERRNNLDYEPPGKCSTIRLERGKREEESENPRR